MIASGAETPVEGEGGVPELRDVRDLTPIQVSYLRGREPGQPYGGVDCLALFEFRRELGEGRPGTAKSCPLDPEALRRAVASLKRHPVMRPVIVDGSHWSSRSNGDDSLPLTISIDDRPNVDGLAENGRNAAVNIDNICSEKRSEILLRQADYATGELGWIDIGYVGTCEVIHIAISLVAADLGGVGVIVNDLAAAYAAYAGAGRITADEDLAPDWLTFGAIAEREREYERDRAKNAKNAKNARNATKTDGDALDTTVADALPLPPALPAPGNDGGADGVGRSVTRHSGALGIPQWERLGRIAEAAGASRPGLLLAIYRHALGLWDPAERLSIVMPGMDKRATPDDVLDRTRAWITRCATSPGITLGEAARGATEEIRRRIRAGLDLDDELRQARSRGDDHPGIPPVVLTCGSEEVLLSPEVGDVFGHLAHTGSVTPQVLCDLQVLRLTADEVRVALDVRDGAYAGTVGEELFSAFFGALRSLAEAAPDTDAAALAALPLDDVIRVAGDTAARRRALNGTAAAPDALLHAPFLERVEQAPDATAVIDPGNGDPLTYAELHRAALALADELADTVQPGDFVGIRLPKGRDQITAVLAVLYLGAAYLPISAHAPLAAASPYARRAAHGPARRRRPGMGLLRSGAGSRDVGCRRRRRLAGGRAVCGGHAHRRRCPGTRHAGTQPSLLVRAALVARRFRSTAGAGTDRLAGFRAHRSAGGEVVNGTMVPLPGSGAAADLPSVLVFPHAGGSPRQYAKWARVFSGAGAPVAGLGVTYPGRDRRIGAAHPRTIQCLAGEVADAIEDMGTMPAVLAGHSLGATVAVETLREIHRRHPGERLPVLVASGQAAPEHAGGGCLHESDDAVLLDELSRLDDATAQVMEDPEMSALLLPVIKEDYRLIETYVASPPPVVVMKTTIITVRGVSDDDLPKAAMRGWQAWASRVIGPVAVPGDHFHHLKHKDLAVLCRMIALASSRTVRHRSVGEKNVDDKTRNDERQMKEVLP